MPSFCYGCALDGPEFPCDLVRPQRDEQSYVLLDTATADTLVLDDKSFFRPLGTQHFYDSFALDSQICVRRDALELFGLNDDQNALRLTGKKSLLLLYMWPRTRQLPTQTRTSQSPPLLTLKKAIVQVNLSRTNCLSVSRWFLLPQTFSRLQTVFAKGWAPLHLVLFGCLCLWFFGFVFLVLFWKVQGVF